MLESAKVDDREISDMESYKILVDLSESVFHDLKNILATISGLAQLSLMKVIDSEVIINLTNIVQATVSFKDALDRYYHFTQGYNEEEKRAYRLQDIILKTIEMIRFKLNVLSTMGKEIQLGFCINSNSKIFCNEYEIKQGLLNILMNAIESMEENGGNLSIRLYDADNWVFMEIEDTGIGISPDNLEKIFKVEFTTKEKGTGLGLKIAKRSIEKIGGKIELTSELGVGTRILISLPAYSET